MKAADITQLSYLFDMYYCVSYNKNMIENPESIFSRLFVLSFVDKYGGKETPANMDVITRLPKYALWAAKFLHRAHHHHHQVAPDA